MRTLFTLAAMLLLMVVSANATRTYVDLSNDIANGTTSKFTASTGKLEWKTTGGGATIVLPGLSGDLSDWENIVLNTADYEATYRCVIKVQDGDNQVDYTWAMYSAGTKNLPLTGDGSSFKNGDNKLTKELLKNVVNVQLGGMYGGTGSLTVSSIYLNKTMNIVFDDNGQYTIDNTDLSVTGDLTYNDATGIVTIPAGKSGNLSVNLPSEQNFLALTNVKLTADDASLINLFHMGDKNNGTIADYYSSKVNASPSADRRGKSSAINSMYWNLNNTGSEDKTLTISSIVLTEKIITDRYGYVAPEGTTDLKNLTGTNTGWASSVTYPKTFAAYGESYGDGNGDKESTHVNISDYDYICFQVTNTSTGLPLRVWIWDDTNSKVVTLYPYPIGQYSTADYTKAYNITDPGVYVVKVSDYKYLKGIKAENASASAVIVDLAYCITGEAPDSYSATQEYIIKNSSVLNDVSVTCIDARSLEGSHSFTSANTNCLFLSNGKVSNESNVIVDGVINKLTIDETKAFALPLSLTATAASYTRAASGTYGTICIPYAVSSNANVQYYTLGANNGSTLTIEPVTTVAAGTPAIFRNISGSDLTVTGSGKLAANVNGSASTGTVLTLKGTYTQYTVDSTTGTDDQKTAAKTTLAKLYYISGDKVMNATSKLTVNPFRAYMEASANGSAKSYNLFEADDLTAINAIFNSDNSEVKVAEIYSINGAKQNELQKGINIVKFSNGTSKKVILK